MRNAIFKPSEKETGIKVIGAVGPAMPTVRAMVNTGGPECDVVEALPGDFEQLSSKGMFERLDRTAMDGRLLAEFSKDDPQPFGVDGLGIRRPLPSIPTNIRKRTRRGAGPTYGTLSTLRGLAFCMRGAFILPIEIALADGVAPDQLYPLDFRRAYAALSRINSNFVTWASSAALQVEVPNSGELPKEAAS
ncbi:hypothetical protein [Bradyrhizobium sp. CB3481]|uniref:hypothetical protein n=1 Tax=Bradyrhizobium sp. CB3481 TaxID=3039158 RepID=UPI0024B1E884|nr:hypothetical protein [Bradyrhizobium sp. CB3481]WFU14594.1 hypothetical protein QA643_26220 [Bradyrhizobium sp. CB3481]